MEALLAAYEDEEDNAKPTERKGQKRPGEDLESPKHKQGKKEVAGVSKLPPLPPSFGASTSESAESASETSADGRIRSFPHVEGNYATFIYIPVRLPTESTTAILKRIGKQAPFELHTDYDVHVSLSRVFAVREHHIKPMTELLTKRVSARLKDRAFSVTYTKFDWFINDEHTRSFLALLIGPGKQRVMELIAAVDSVLKEFGFPVYYEDPKPHTSVAWLVGDITAALPTDSRQGVLERGETFTLEVSQAVCKCGKWTFPLVT